MSRITTVVASGAALALITTCASPTAPDELPTRVQSSAELTAVALGVAIDAPDDSGAPRLVRAVVPRAAIAGMTPDEAARDHLTALAPLWIAPHGRAADLSSIGEQRLRNGASIVRLQQRIDRVDIHQGELRVMVQSDGSLAAVSGTLHASAGRASFQSSATAALERALDMLYGDARTRPAITQGAETAGYRELTVADNPEFRVQRARAKPELLPAGDQLLAIWSVELMAEKLDLDDVTELIARRYLIGDADGRLVRDVDLVASDAFTYRVFADPGGRPLDGALDSFNPHPTGVPDGSLPPPAPYDLVTMEAFNGPHDPWLPAGATTTTGNNVDAFADMFLPLGFNDGDIRPEVGPDRTFDRRYDFTAEPLATENQSMAAAVNVFFVINWLHDWYYDSGFTEATGNAQTDNFGRGGVADDPLIAHAQANAIGGSRNNANIATPDDGLSPNMNMFLWTGKATTSLTTPTGTPSSLGFVNGPRSFDITGIVALAQDRTGGTHRACTRVNSLSGRIALYEFDGTCNSSVSINNLRSAGAIGVIAMIAIPGSPAQSLTGSTANVPGVVIGNDDGHALEAALPVTVTMHRTTALERDGDLDNAIIAHEWGHYLHHRLASCESATGQCAAMSEGWGDFNALLMMLRDTDGRDGTFGAALYALTGGGLGVAGFSDPGYFGIRRFPYSVDRSKNGLSFRHISDGVALPATPINAGPAVNRNSEVHNAGEIWAQMLWDVYNVLLDQHPFAEARRRMTDYVVSSLLLTPPEATVTEARDALLAAAGAIDTDDMLLMAAAFAGRGAGTCAASPARGSTDFTGVVESGAISARLATSPVTVSDDGVSCDHDGYLDPGESGTLRITLSNSGAIAAESVAVTATTTTPGVTLGRRLDVGLIAAGTHVDVAIPIRLSTAAPVSSMLDVAVRVDGDAGCNTSKFLLDLHARIGVDEKPAIATADTIETNLVAWTSAGDFGGALWGRAAEPGNHVLFGVEAAVEADTQIVSPVLQVSPTDPLVVTLQHSYNMSATPFAGVFFNGGVVEISNDGGATWRDVRQVGVDPGYPGVISVDFINPLSGRRVFGGKNPHFPARDPLTLDFGTQFAGQAVQLRFRIGTEICCTTSGWSLDDITVAGITNTPFPGFVPQPTKCLIGTPAGEDSSIVGIRSAPRRHLATR